MAQHAASLKPKAGSRRRLQASRRLGCMMAQQVASLRPKAGSRRRQQASRRRARATLDHNCVVVEWPCGVNMYGTRPLLWQQTCMAHARYSGSSSKAPRRGAYADVLVETLARVLITAPCRSRRGRQWYRCFSQRAHQGSREYGYPAYTRQGLRSVRQHRHTLGWHRAGKLDMAGVVPKHPAGWGRWHGVGLTFPATW